ncbi:hypothetical protein V3C99_004344 [Haemonchus contortus]|uniref:C2H2-type domain-containing protein n=1 Tax=Haemonchus contortus TaxID=6289 RepID=A0A7I4XWR5_HAECO|nr:zinc finger protein 800-like [Haemonchus contortus]
MSTHHSEDLSVLCPQIPTSVDDTTGLIRALQNGTEEVRHLLKNSCNLILECRTCKAVFRHAINFHHHKLSVCRAYHQPLLPTYEQVLAFQKEVAAAYNHDRPSTSKEFLVHREEDFQREILEDDDDFIDVYDGLEEFCGEIDSLDSPEPGEYIEESGEYIDEQDDISVFDDGMSDSIEEGEYIEDSSISNCPATPSSTTSMDQADTSEVAASDKKDTSGEDSDAISVPESPPPDCHLNFPIFNDQLLESPTDYDYFGKGEKEPAGPLLLPVGQME